MNKTGRRGGLMVSALVSGSSGPGSSPGRGHCVVFLGKTLYSHSAHPIQGGVEILLVTSCYRNRDKLRPDGPLGSHADYEQNCFYRLLYVRCMSD